MARLDANRDLIPGLRVIHVFERGDWRFRLALPADSALCLQKIVLGEWQNVSAYEYGATLLNELADVAGRLNFDGTGED